MSRMYTMYTRKIKEATMIPKHWLSDRTTCREGGRGRPLWPFLALIVLFPAASQAQVRTEDFEDDTLGLLPGGWSDVRLFGDPLNLPNPSAVVVQTTGPSGRATQALEIVAALPTGPEDLLTQGFRG